MEGILRTLLIGEGTCGTWCLYSSLLLFETRLASDLKRGGIKGVRRHTHPALLIISFSPLIEKMGHLIDISHTDHAML